LASESSRSRGTQHLSSDFQFREGGSPLRRAVQMSDVVNGDNLQKRFNSAESPLKPFINSSASKCFFSLCFLNKTGKLNAEMTADFLT